MNRYTRQDLIRLLHTLRDRVGRTPMEYDTYDYSDIPSHVTYCKRFGSWRDALQAAGIPLNHTYMGYDRETLLARLREMVEELGRVPTVLELPALGGPTSTTYVRHFGSWSAALKQLGLEPRTGPSYDTEELLEMLRHVADELGHAPSVAEFNEREGLAAPRTVRYRFGTWNNALRAAGLTPRHPTPKRQLAERHRSHFKPVLPSHVKLINSAEEARHA